MDPTDKPRADSKLKTLPEDRQADIAAYATDHTLAETTQWLSAQGIPISSGRLSIFLSWYHARQQLERNDTALQQLLDRTSNTDPALTPDKLHELGTRFFTSLALERQDPKMWYVAQQIACNKAYLELELQKYRDQVEARKQAIQHQLDDAKSEGGLSPETIARIEKELNLF